MAKLAKLSSKNQITLPKALLVNYPDIEYFDASISANEGGILLKPVRTQSQGSALEQVRAHFKRLGITEKDIEDAVRWARRQKKSDH